MNGVPADSVAVSSYLGSVSYLTGSTFRDDITPASLAAAPFSVVIEGSNMSSVEIKAMPDSNGKQVILSNTNPGTVFDGEAGDLFTKIFVGRGKFQPTDNWDYFNKKGPSSDGFFFGYI